MGTEEKNYIQRNYKINKRKIVLRNTFIRKIKSLEAEKQLPMDKIKQKNNI